jgi:hypothetical protein
MREFARLTAEPATAAATQAIRERHDRLRSAQRVGLADATLRIFAVWQNEANNISNISCFQ